MNEFVGCKDNKIVTLREPQGKLIDEYGSDVRDLKIDGLPKKQKIVILVVDVLNKSTIFE